MKLLKGTIIKVNNNLLTLDEDIESRSVYMEGRPIRRVECFEINNELIPIEKILTSQTMIAEIKND